MSAIPEDTLPPILAEIADVIGLDAMLTLVKRFGGIRIYVRSHPRKVRPDDPLAIALGLDVARRLTEAFASEELPIPKMYGWGLSIRNAEIYRLHHEEGWPAWRIARKYQLTERQVYSILSAWSDDNTQAELF